MELGDRQQSVPLYRGRISEMMFAPFFIGIFHGGYQLGCAQ